jgi:uncharacterized OB-fold protein
VTSVDYRGMRLILPENDSEFLGYFAAAARHELVVKRCSSCGLLRHPPGPGCPWCTSLDWSWHAVSGKGTIYSYEITMHSVQPGFRDLTPYPVVVVELDEQRGIPTPGDGIRIIANLVDEEFHPEAEANVAIGARVKVVFQDLGEEISLPQFALSDEVPLEPLWRFPG